MYRTSELQFWLWFLCLLINDQDRTTISTNIRIQYNQPPGGTKGIDCNHAHHDDRAINVLMLMMMNQGKVNDQEIPFYWFIEHQYMTTGCNMIQQAKKWWVFAQDHVVSGLSRRISDSEKPKTERHMHHGPVPESLTSAWHGLTQRDWTYGCVWKWLVHVSTPKPNGFADHYPY